MTQSDIAGELPNDVEYGPEGTLAVRSPWWTAAVVGLTGTWLLFDTSVGVNWPVTIILIALGLHAVARVLAGDSRIRYAQLPIALALLLAGGAAVTTNRALHFWMALGILTLLGAATLCVAGLGPAYFGPFRLATASLRALPPLARETAGRTGAEARSLLRNEGRFRAVRGTAIALPIVIVFFLLLGAADPTFGDWRDQAFLAVRDLTLLPRALFFCVLTATLVGFYGLSLHEAGEIYGRESHFKLNVSLSGTERVIVLGSVAALFALFLVMQASYLFGDPGSRPGSGVTYAEAVRRGFGELTIVVTLSAWLILVCDRWAMRDTHDARVRWLSFALVLECLLLLASAAHRLAAYQAAYGYTSYRLYVALYIGAAAAALAALAWEIARGIDLPRLTRHVAVIGVLALCIPAYWNSAAWVVRRNLERYETTHELDRYYLASQLSDDALPEVVAALPRLSASDRACVVDLLRQRGGWSHDTNNDRRWFERNPRATRAQRAWAALGAADVDRTRPANRGPPGRVNHQCG